MKLLVLADIDGFQWQGGSGRADILLSLGDIAGGKRLDLCRKK